MVDFGTVVTGKEKHKFLELNAKFEEILKAYEERGNKIQQLETQVSQMDKLLGKRKVGEPSRPRIVYPRPPIEPFKSTPIVELLDTPQRLEFYTTKELEEEKNKSWALHVELNNQYEDKLKKKSYIY